MTTRTNQIDRVHKLNPPPRKRVPLSPNLQTVVATGEATHIMANKRRVFTDFGCYSGRHHLGFLLSLVGGWEFERIISRLTTKPRLPETFFIRQNALTYSFWNAFWTDCESYVVVPFARLHTVDSSNCLGRIIFCTEFKRQLISYTYSYDCSVPCSEKAAVKF